MTIRLALVALLGCTTNKPVTSTNQDAGDAVDPLSWSVEEMGPFNVGYQSWEHTYTVSEALGERTIRIHLWYPTADTAGPVGEYTVGTDPNVITEASPEAPAYAQGYPVHVHSHGDLDVGTASAFLSRYLSSHGWVSVAMDHTGNTLLDLTADPQSANFFHRPLDVRAALDAVEQTEILGGQANTQAVVLSGHSRGAYTTWSSLGASYDMDSVREMCASGDGVDGDVCTPEEVAMFETDLSDERVVATIPMDGTIRRQWFGDSGESSVRGPVLYFSSADSGGSQDQFESLAPIDFTWVTLEGACHQSFANGGCTSLDTEEGFRLVGAYSLAFSRRVILDDTGSDVADLLIGSVTLSDIVSVHRR